MTEIENMQKTLNVVSSLINTSTDAQRVMNKERWVELFSKKRKMARLIIVDRLNEAITTAYNWYPNSTEESTKRLLGTTLSLAEQYLEYIK